MKYKVSDNFTNFFVSLSEIFSFMGKYFKEVFLPPYEFSELVRQFYLIGNKTLLIVTVTGFITGFVLVLQSLPTLKPFGAVSLIPNMVAIGMVREIGPVIISLICAGKIGSGIGAELGSMKVTEQIDAMEVQATNPFKYLVITRIAATTVMVPLLVFYADAIALFGAWIAYSIYNPIPLSIYLSQSMSRMEFIDFVPATVKTLFFGFTIGLLGSYHGYNAERGTESVGFAANKAVVWSSLTIIILDMLVVQVTNLIAEL